MVKKADEARSESSATMNWEWRPENADDSILLGKGHNYGPRFDLIDTEIIGTFEIIGRKGDGRVIKDLSSHKWVYKVGLHGPDNQLYSANSRFASK
ncbi:Beta-galactosidase 7 [Sarracenia purpurea var. burkii]